jgi:hypothetical protein
MGLSALFLSATFDVQDLFFCVKFIKCTFSTFYLNMLKTFNNKSFYFI